MVYTEIRVYMPAIKTQEEMTELLEGRPYVTRLVLPYHSKFLHVCSVPSLVDLLGFSSGGGPPGYAYAIGPGQPRGDYTQERRVLLFCIHLGQSLEIPRKVEESGWGYVLTPLGATQSAGRLLGHFEMSGPAVHSGIVQKALEENGAVVHDTVLYTLPTGFAPPSNSPKDI